MRNLARKMIWIAAASAAAFVSGCAGPAMSSSLLIEPDAQVVMYPASAATSSLTLTNQSDHAIDITMHRNSELSHVSVHLEPGGTCQAGLGDVQQITIHNDADTAALIAWRATGHGRLTTSIQRNERPARYTLVP